LLFVVDFVLLTTNIVTVLLHNVFQMWLLMSLLHVMSTLPTQLFVHVRVPSVCLPFRISVYFNNYLLEVWISTLMQFA